jgi:hypothetical protein
MNIILHREISFEIFSEIDSFGSNLRYLYHTYYFEFLKIKHTMENDLTLSEKLLLMAIRPEKGGLMWISSHSLDFTLVGATLLDMELSGNISIIDKKVEISNEKSQVSLHRYVLEKLMKSNRPRKIGHWMEPFALSKRKIRRELYQSLVQKNEIRLEDRHFLFLNWKKPYLTGSNHTYRLISSIKNSVYQFPENPHDMYLIVLMEPAELWRRVYPDWASRRSARQKIKQNLDKNQATEGMTHAVEAVKAVRQAIRASEAAARAAAT